MKSFLRKKKQPQPFEPGDIIDFVSKQFRVLDNSGASGTVESWPDRRRTYRDFRWSFNGLQCRRIGHAPLSDNREIRRGH